MEQIRADRRRVFVALAALVFVLAGLMNAFVVPDAEATHTPADKVVAAGKYVEEINGSEGDRTPTVLSATLRTSKPTDLILLLSMECSIITDITTGGGGLTTDTATAEGKVRAWIEIDGKPVAVNQIGGAAQNGSTPGDNGKITFCNRVHTRTVNDDENGDGTDEYRDYQRTKSANGFNWLQLNLGSGIHEIVVKAEYTSQNGTRALSDAYIGTRSLIVIPSKLANDATI